MKNIIYNPFLKDYKNPVGAVKNSDDILITINIVKEYNIFHLRLIMNDDNNQCVHRFELSNVSSNEIYNCFQVCFKIEEMGLYWYFFEFEDVFGRHYIGSSNNLDAVLTDYYPISWQLSIHDGFESELLWFKGKIMYQIFVDRFHKVGKMTERADAIVHRNWNENPNHQLVNGEVLNNDFFGGNLQGIIAKLDYLKSLNVSIIYLNPIFEAFSNHKYDTGDYLKIDSMFGTEEDFIELCARAKELGISIILDGVFNHTGADSRYFNKYHKYEEIGAYQSKSSRYYPWYKFINYPNEYYSWWNVLSLPALNQDCQDYLDFITGENGVIHKWLNNGAKGFRLDVVDELNDYFINLIHERIKLENKENIVIGEVWEDASNKIAYGKRKNYFNGHQLDSVMNYPLKNAIFDYINHNNLNSLKHLMRTLINNYPKSILDNLMNHLGTHDTIRLLNNFAYISVDTLTKDEQANYKMSLEEYKNAFIRLKMATALQYTLPGVPSIFYGDETGLQGFNDPFCRHTINWDNIDSNILNWYKLLGEIRKDPVYVDGLYEEEFIENNVFAFSRSNNQYKIMTIINNNNTNFSFNLLNAFDLIQGIKIQGRIVTPKKGVSIIKIEK